jgi:hypothetical protein
MTEARVVREIKRLCDAFRLHEWEVFVEAPDIAQLDARGKVGSCVPDERSMVCRIVVAAGRPDDEVLETCLHEVSHLAMRPTTTVFNHLIDQLGQGAWDVAKAAFEDAEERNAIRLVRAVRTLTEGV